MRLSRLNIKKINLNDINKNYSGQDKPYYMGCSGIGLGRIIACII